MRVERRLKDSYHYSICYTKAFSYMLPIIPSKTLTDLKLDLVEGVAQQPAALHLGVTRNLHVCCIITPLTSR